MKKPGGLSDSNLPPCEFCSLPVKDIKRAYVNLDNRYNIAHKKCEHWLRWTAKRYRRYSWFIKRWMDENFKDHDLVAGEYDWATWG